MAVIESILSAIGNTPLVELKRISPEGGRVFAKLEYLNPSGSIKDRIIRPMIEDAVARGLLEEGGTIVEPTSGNTGISMSFIAAAMGYKAVLVMPETMSKERVQFIRSYGAEIVLTPGDEGMDGSIRIAREIAEERGGYVPNQYDNPVNTEVHCRTTGAEIVRDLPGLSAVFAGVGTGGTASGIGKAIREAGLGAKVYAIEPAESPILSKGWAAPHRIQGIGVNIVPGNYRPDYIEGIIGVPDQEAVDMAVRLAREEAIFGGVSSGANVYAACRYVEENPGSDVVAIIPDRADRYFSTGMYD
ncbi:MAG: cysteine synthase family protein [Candidatus Methanomethylophilaceae archaeon]|nr:cysteine synthase family protein [Candidatus Methanomethylophilaceae archaeon]